MATTKDSNAYLMYPPPLGTLLAKFHLSQIGLKIEFRS